MTDVVPGTATAAAGPADLMRQGFAAVAARDPAAIAAMDHPDVVERFLALDLVLRGPTEVEAFFAEMFAAVPDLEFEVEAVHEVDDRVAVGQWHLTGTFDGGRFQGIAATGRRVELRGIDVMVFENGLLVENTIYYDGLTFARQAGLLPAAGSVTDRALLALRNGLSGLLLRRSRR